MGNSIYKDDKKFIEHLISKLDDANKSNNTFAAQNTKDRLDRLGVIVEQGKKGITWRMREGI